MTHLYIPPTAYEAMKQYLPALRKVVPNLLAKLHPELKAKGLDYLSPSIPPPEFISKAVEGYAYKLYAYDGLPKEQAIADGNMLGQHLAYMLNFELIGRKLFWVDEALAYMLAQTDLDIDGEVLRLPFRACAFVFIDRYTLSLGEDLLRRHGTESSHSTRPLTIITAHVLEEDSLDGRRCLHFDLLFDSKNGTGAWPYLVSRDLGIGPKDNLETMLESCYHDVVPTRRDPIFTSPELKRLLKVIINAILYAISAGVTPVTMESPIADLRRKKNKLGRSKQDKMMERITEMKGRFSGERVFYLPGKITISQYKHYREMEKTHHGRTMMKRFMVRGHWRRANPSWQDQALRWIEPYWKGPEMAVVIEKEYRMVP
jgi:hypothetical protein